MNTQYFQLHDQACFLCLALHELFMSLPFDHPDYFRVSSIAQKADSRASRRFSLYRNSRIAEDSDCLFSRQDREEAAAVEREAFQEPEEHFLEPAGYSVVHADSDPDSCPDCFGTGLDFTHTADFCPTCKPAGGVIVQKDKPGDSARLSAGAPGNASASASSRAGRQFTNPQPWKKFCSYGVRWNRRNYYRAKHLARLIMHFHNDGTMLVDAYFELMSNLAGYDRLADRRPGYLREYLDLPF